jgi:hypothetical protein
MKFCKGRFHGRTRRLRKPLKEERTFHVNLAFMRCHHFAVSNVETCGALPAAPCFNDEGRKRPVAQRQVGVFSIYVCVCSIRVRILQQHAGIDWE